MLQSTDLYMSNRRLTQNIVVKALALKYQMFSSRDNIPISIKKFCSYGAASSYFRAPRGI